MDARGSKRVVRGRLAAAVLALATAGVSVNADAQERRFTVKGRPETTDYVNGPTQNRIRALPKGPGDVREPERPENERGVSPPVSYINHEEDSLAVLLNITNPFNNCLEFKIYPCICIKLSPLGFPVDFDVVHSYRWPVQKVETAKYNWQSNYIFNELIEMQQEMLDTQYKGDKVPGDRQIAQSDMNRLLGGLAMNKDVHGHPFKVPAEVTVNEQALNDLTKNEHWQKYRNFWTNNYLDGGRYGTYHLFPEQLRWLRFGCELKGILGFNSRHCPFEVHKVKPSMASYHYGDFIDNYYLSWEEWATAGLKGNLAKMSGTLLSDPFVCAKFAMQDGTAPRDLMTPYKSPARTSPHPCLRFNNGRWLPFTQHVDPVAQPMGGAVQSLKAMKSACALKRDQFYDYDGKTDKLQYVRGQGMVSPVCVDLERAWAEYGEANQEENPTETIVAVHWKWVKGCSFEPDLLIGTQCQPLDNGAACSDVYNNVGGPPKLFDHGL